MMSLLKTGLAGVSSTKRTSWKIMSCNIACMAPSGNRRAVELGQPAAR